MNLLYQDFWVYAYSKSEAESICAILHELGCEWASRESLRNDTYWRKDDIFMGYHVKNRTVTYSKVDDNPDRFYFTYEEFVVMFEGGEQPSLVIPDDLL